MHKQDVSDEYLNSYIDNQLDPAEKIQAFDTIRQDEKLKERVCELRGLKEIIQQAYSQPPTYKHAPVTPVRYSAKYFQTLAACLLLLAGGTTGWFTHAWSSGRNHHGISAMLQDSQQEVSATDTRKVIVHLGNANAARLKATLDETEGLLETYKRAHLQLQVEVIANKRGVNLLRSDASDYKERITLMQAKYPNLNFLVCGQTMNKLRDKGESVQLLPHTGVVPSAAEQINKRLLQGWGYVRI